ncbi:MAG: hypothetical protein WCP56_03160 [Candidatus Saccharibacteria bacterium]
MPEPSNPTEPEQAPQSQPHPAVEPAPVAPELIPSTVGEPAAPVDTPSASADNVAATVEPAPPTNITAAAVASPANGNTEDVPPFYRKSIGFVLISVFIPLVGVIPGLIIALTGKVYFHRKGEYVPMSKLQSIFIPVMGFLISFSGLLSILL